MAQKRDVGKVLLSCHCERDFLKPWPQILDEMWCVKHNKQVTVTRTPESSGNYGFLCSCGYGRTTGAAKVLAETKATVHHQKYPHHVTTLTDGGKAYYRYPAYSDPVLFYGDQLPEDPPF